MPAPSQRIKDKCDDLKQKLSKFHPAKSASKPEGYPYVIEWEARANYCVFKKTYTESADGVNVGTVKELFKVVHSNGYSLRNKEYIAGDVLCGDSVVKDGVCFNVLKEPISKWEKNYHYEYLFSKDLILIRTSDFYNGYILKQEETEVAAKDAGNAENASKKIKEMEEQLQSKKEESDNMKEEFKEMNGYIAELEKWIEEVNDKAKKIPQSMWNKKHPQQGGDAAGPSGKDKGIGWFGKKK